MNIDELNQLSLEELLASLPQGGYSFQTKSGDWIHGAVEQTWDGDPQDIDRDDSLPSFTGISNSCKEKENPMRMAMIVW